MIIVAFIVIALVAGFVAKYLVGGKRHYETWELFVVGLVGQCVADLLQVEAAQVQHPARIDPSSSPSLKKQARSAAT